MSPVIQDQTQSVRKSSKPSQAHKTPTGLCQNIMIKFCCYRGGYFALVLLYNYTYMYIYGCIYVCLNRFINVYIWMYTHCIYTLHIFISSPMGHWNSFLAIWRRALRACWIALYHGEGPYKTVKGLMARWRTPRHGERPYGTVKSLMARWMTPQHGKGSYGMVKGLMAR